MKPFLCTICGMRRFATDYGRAEHQRALHGIRVSGERSIPCSYPFCTRKFRHEFHLKQHLENPGKRHDRKGVTTETPSIRCMRPHVNDLRGNSSSYLPPTVLFVPPRREEEKAIFERTCSSLEVNKFICDKLQPDEIFHCLFNDAIDSLYRELQRDLQYTNYGIHNLIKVIQLLKASKTQTISD
ncbi:uncharacterized protein [Montipora foliosa]|uniref:uncharacterized protein isoform X2 n=1 Tax=Montipora foliosa TaxID=591990 RepID=UPI0035F144C0